LRQSPRTERHAWSAAASSHKRRPTSR
jgi:hypothetical protein